MKDKQDCRLWWKYVCLEKLWLRWGRFVLRHLLVDDTQKTETKMHVLHVSPRDMTSAFSISLFLISWWLLVWRYVGLQTVVKMGVPGKITGRWRKCVLRVSPRDMHQPSAFLFPAPDPDLRSPFQSTATLFPISRCWWSRLGMRMTRRMRNSMIWEW